MSKASISKAVKLLEYIRINTDEDHKATQDDLRKLLGDETAREVMGDKGTYARRLREIADAYNTDQEGKLLPKHLWKIVFPGFGRDKSDGKRNGKVYYSHPVTGEELAFLVNSVRQTHNLSGEEKISLEQRIRFALGSRYYPEPEAFAGCIIRDLDAAQGDDMSRIETNIERLRYYIKKGMMADITVYRSTGADGDTDTTVCESTDTDDNTYIHKYQISPYKIVRKNSFYWLIANWHERPAETYPYPAGKEIYRIRERFYPWYSDELTAFRIDLIQGIEDAHVPPVTDIHWTMTGNWLPPEGIQKVQKRYNKGSLRKARHGKTVTENIEQYDKTAENLELDHCKDIKLN